MVEDIWVKKSLRPTSELMRCLNLSEKNNTIEYLDRLSIIGDMAIGPVSAGAIKLLSENHEIDPEFKLILTINFYLIWLNEK